MGGVAGGGKEGGGFRFVVEGDGGEGGREIEMEVPGLDAIGDAVAAGIIRQAGLATDLELPDP